MKKLLIALVLIAGCKDKAKDEAKAPEAKPVETKPAETKPAETKPTEAKPGVLKLAQAKLTAEGAGQKAELVVQADGKVMLDGKEVALLNTAGELAIDGKIAATMGADGKMTIVGESEKIEIREDGAMMTKDGKVALEPKPDGTLGGLLAETELKDTKMKIEGDKAGYRALMFAWMGVSKASK